LFAAQLRLPGGPDVQSVAAYHEDTHLNLFDLNLAILQDNGGVKIKQQ